VSGSLLGFVIEGLVALLLLVTIGYCMVLNRRLKRLRADEEVLRETVTELVRATGIAERAISGLKETAAECDQSLSQKLHQADRFCRSLEVQISQGEKILARLARISGVARHHGLVERPGATEPRPADDRFPGRAA
jgi:DNA-binding Xre family transcriptional regulator